MYRHLDFFEMVRTEDERQLAKKFEAVSAAISNFSICLNWLNALTLIVLVYVNVLCWNICQKIFSTFNMNS